MATSGLANMPPLPSPSSSAYSPAPAEDSRFSHTLEGKMASSASVNTAVAGTGDGDLWSVGRTSDGVVDERTGDGALGRFMPPGVRDKRRNLWEGEEQVVILDDVERDMLTRVLQIQHRRPDAIENEENLKDQPKEWREGRTVTWA